MCTEVLNTRTFCQFLNMFAKFKFSIIHFVNHFKIWKKNEKVKFKRELQLISIKIFYSILRVGTRVQIICSPPSPSLFPSPIPSLLPHHISWSPQLSPSPFLLPPSSSLLGLSFPNCDVLSRDIIYMRIAF